VSLRRRNSPVVRLKGPYTLPGALVMTLVTILGWSFRHALWALFREQKSLLPSVFAALVIMTATLACVLWGEAESRRCGWLRKAERSTGLHRLSRPSRLSRWMRRLPDPLEWVCTPLLRTRAGRRLAEDWKDAGLGEKPSRYFLLLAMTGATGWVFGHRVAGTIVGLAMAVGLPFLPRALVASRASNQRRRFGDQLPQALDSLAAGLTAGLSLPQAVDFSRQELPDPIRHVMGKLSRRMALGIPVEEAFRSLLVERPEESLALAIEGIVLQRRFGGDLVRMLEETAELVRERVELEREVRTVTTQGRFSGIVIAALVPVSAAILLLFNPAYIDVLFDTIEGQVLLVIALLLLFIGWWIISRMVRVRY
jgi:tight adherence protein B